MAYPANSNVIATSANSPGAWPLSIASCMHLRVEVTEGEKILCLDGSDWIAIIRRSPNGHGIMDILVVELTDGFSHCP